MRDPDRIDPFIERIRSVWKKNPDWRFGQLVVNLERLLGSPLQSRDIFYLEDDTWDEAFDLIDCASS